VKPRTKAVFALGAVEYRTRYHPALQRRAAWQASLRRVFREVDFIALPTLQKLPPAVPFFGGTPAFEALVLGQQNTAAVNYAGNPALALPIPVQDKKVPLTSVQLIGRPRSEAELLNAGRLLEAKL
jgi:Asp-tRNA(Asn)/Glu-tRNA(Gln) amidotransferase A subunit family amidase